MWQRVASSAEVGAGAIVDGVLDNGELPIDVVVWRTFDGRPCVMDARCPHQWSHLGAEGFVDGDEIVCTAHFWRFTVDGTGSKLNVNGRRDLKADIDVFVCEERDGAIWVDR
jgi:nitrite reductase/ring-hydroxylating ferredoxin subunit